MEYRTFTAGTKEGLVEEVQKYLNELSDSPVPLHRHFLLTKSENIDDTEAWGHHELPLRLAAERKLIVEVYDIKIRVRSEVNDHEFAKIGQTVVMTEDPKEPAAYVAYVAGPEDQG